MKNGDILKIGEEAQNNGESGKNNSENWRLKLAEGDVIDVLRHKKERSTDIDGRKPVDWGVKAWTRAAIMSIY